MKEVLEEDEKVPLKISFEVSVALTNPTGSGEGESSTIIPPTQEFNLLIGADGMYSQIRTQVMQCPPPVPPTCSPPLTGFDLSWISLFRLDFFLVQVYARVDLYLFSTVT